MKTDPFPVLGPLLSFLNFWHIECSTLTVPSVRIWNSSAGILSPLLALLVVMLPKAPWLHTPGCLALGKWLHHCDYLGREDLFCIVLLAISSASVRSIPFLSFIVPILALNVPLIFPVFLKKSLIFPVLLFSSISLHCSLENAFLPLLSILWNSALSWVYLSLGFHLSSFLSYL